MVESQHTSVGNQIQSSGRTLSTLKSYRAISADFHLGCFIADCFLDHKSFAWIWRKFDEPLGMWRDNHIIEDVASL